MILNQNLVCVSRTSVMGVLGFDYAKWPWFLLLRFLDLPLTICLSVVLASLADSDSGLTLL